MAENDLNPKKVSFSQAQGYESLPQPLKLEELSQRARVRFWDAIYMHLPDDEEMLLCVHREFFGDSVEKFYRNWIAVEEYDYGNNNQNFQSIKDDYKNFIVGGSFNKIFDFLTFLMRRPQCSREFIRAVGLVFQDCHLAYRLDESYPPTIYPAATPQEGEAITEALQRLREAGMGGAQQHLEKAAACINGGDWTGGVRESIHAVESAARQIASGDAKALGTALQKLEGAGVLQHAALRKAFIALYGYTSDEQGIRHALLAQDAPQVGRDEAVFMLGACASFASYLCRKQQALPREGDA